MLLLAVCVTEHFITIATCQQADVYTRVNIQTNDNSHTSYSLKQIISIPLSAVVTQNGTLNKNTVNVIVRLPFAWCRVVMSET